MLLLVKKTTDAPFKPASERAEVCFLSVDWIHDERYGFERGYLCIATWLSGMRRLREWQIGTMLRHKAIEIADAIGRDFEENGGRKDWQPPSLEEIATDVMDTNQDMIAGPESSAEERIDASYNRIVSILTRVLGSGEKRQGGASEPPLDWQAAAKALAHYVKDGDTIRMRLEDVQSMIRHILELRAKLRELQEIGKDLYEENQSLIRFKASVDEALNSGDGSYRP